jgi:IS4 transposase
MIPAMYESTAVTDTLRSILDPERIEKEARAVGALRRQRRIDLCAFVSTLVLAFGVGNKRTLSALQTAYEEKARQNVARSSFHDRFTPAAATLLRRLALAAIESAGVIGGAAPGFLSGVRELLALDSTVIRLHRFLSKAYAATRTNHTQAAAKLHVVMNVIDGSPNQVKLTPERTNDQTPWKRVGQWVRERLLLFDLGYFSYHLFHRIAHNGGFFLTRLKANANPLIVAAHRKWRGRSIPLVGRRLKDVLSDLRRQVLDVEVEVSFECRAYRGRRSRGRERFRLVALRNEATGTYHVYLTNLRPDQLAAEDIPATYALRWQVELFWKSMKSHGHLEELPGYKKAVVECLIWASVLSVLTSHALWRLVRQFTPPDRHLPLLRWAALFTRIAADLLELLCSSDLDLADRLFRLLLHDAPDPNVHRRRAHAHAHP